MTLDTSHSARPPFPAPVPSEDNQPFWDALGRGELVVQRCPACGVLQHPPRPMCPECGSFEREWATMSGRGTVFSYVVTHQAIHLSYDGHTPYATVIVELEEGPRLTSNLVDVAPEEIAIGMAVEVVFASIGGDVTLPLFRRA